MTNPNLKTYLATEEMQQATNDKIDGVQTTVHQDITAVSQDIHENFIAPSLSDVGICVADFVHDELTIIKGGLDSDERRITTE